MGLIVGICSLCGGTVIKENSGTSCVSCGAGVKLPVIEMDPATQFDEYTTNPQLLNESEGNDTE